MATLLLVGLPFVAAVGWARSSTAKARRDQPVWLALALFMVIVLGILLNGSIAGLGLLLPAVGGSYLVYRRAAGRPISGVIVFAVAVIGALLLAYLLLGPLRGQFLDRSLSNSDPTTRRTSWVVTVLAALKFFPSGTGLGSFVPIYQFHEALSRVTDVYVNHAHNDYLEALLELGALAPILLILFLIWFVRRTVVLWRSDEAELSQARAGSIAVAIVMLHSFVDYPIRTAAIAAVFALSAGLMAAPVPIIRVATRGSRKAAGRHFTAEEATP
jgi:O-antigen ligase